jgi:hypothetical protein
MGMMMMMMMMIMMMAQEAYKPQNQHELDHEKKVKAKILGPHWRPSNGGKSQRTTMGFGYH